MSSNGDEDVYMPDRLSPSSESRSSSGDPDERPNRFQGPDSTWRGYTQDERTLAASLEQSRANDLSVHLYNAHALKARLYETEPGEDVKPWSAKRQWMQHDEAGETLWHPEPQWTAWPMAAEDVPRKEETFGRSLQDLVDGESAAMNEQSWVPGADLRQEVHALILRRAKERFWHRSWVGGDTETQRGRRGASAGLSGNRDSSQTRQSRSQSRRSTRSEQTGEAGSDEFSDVSKSTADDEASSVPKDDGQLPQFLADDAEASLVLSPSVNHITSRLDNLLAGLQRSRLGHVRDKSGADTRKNEDERKTATSKDDASRRSLGLGSRDWSEVLGLAALTGWEPAVVDRAAKRCASLFGENMTIRLMPETAASGTQDQVVNFVPEMLPSLGSATISETGDTEIESTEVEDLCCPIPTCARFREPFPQRYRLRAHLQRKHDCSPDQILQLYPELAGITSGKSSRASSRAWTQDWEAPDPLVCPLGGCQKPEKVYSERRRLIEHLVREHRWDPRFESPPVSEGSGRSDDSGDQESKRHLMGGEVMETVGAVHNDGFLEYVAAGSLAPWRKGTPALTPARGRSLSAAADKDRKPKRFKGEDSGAEEKEDQADANAEAANEDEVP